MNNEYKIAAMFREKDICVNCTERPPWNNAFRAKTTAYGIECHKRDVDYVTSQLSRLGITYIIRDARYMNTKGCIAHKQFKFLEIPEHEKAYETIIAGGIV